LKIVESAFPTDQDLKKQLLSLIEDELLNDDLAKEMAKRSASYDLFKDLDIQDVQNIDNI
jgi:hypothetical protein